MLLRPILSNISAHCILPTRFVSMRAANNFSWFQELFGFEEPRRKGNYPDDVQQHFRLSEDKKFITSLANDRTFRVGNFSVPSVRDLREQVLKRLQSENVRINLNLQHAIVGDILLEHHKHPLATFQAASQFNCLEFPSPRSAPEDGITFYSTDRTQGPACALACPIGTLYRNYFVEVDDSRSGQRVVGQRSDAQLNNLDDVEAFLNNAHHRYWEVTNGYTFSREKALNDLNITLSTLDSTDPLIDRVKVGVQADTDVIFASRFLPVESPTMVTQVYCSALSVAYSGCSSALWEQLARIVLQANYEATIYAAILNHLNHRHLSQPNNYSHLAFLTFLGGGVFGNELSWICDGIFLAMARVRQAVAAASPAHTDTPPTHAELTLTLGHYGSIHQSAVEHLDACQSIWNA